MSDYTSLTDAELIARCLEQDAGAWEALVRRYQRLVSAIAFKYGFTGADAADVFQSVCLILLRQLEGVRKQENLSNWLITVTVRECWKLKRRSPLTDSLDDPELEFAGGEWSSAKPLAEDEILTLERQHLIRRAVESLAQPCRTLIETLFYREEAPAYTEISRELGIPVPSIGPTRARCLAKLKTALKHLGFD